MPLKLRHLDMGLKFQRSIKVRCRHKVAKVVVPCLILCKERKVIDEFPVRTIARNAQKRADDRLHALALASAGEHYRAIKAIAVANGDRWKPALLGKFGNCLRVNGPFEHRIGRQNAQRNEGSVWHRSNLEILAGFRSVDRR